MELAPRYWPCRCNPGTGRVRTSLVFALLPTRTLMRRHFTRPHITYLASSHFLQSGGHLKSLVKAATSFGGSKLPA